MKRRDFVKIAAASPLFLKLACSESEKDKKPVFYEDDKSFRYLEASGSYFEIGQKIGEFAKNEINYVFQHRTNWVKRLKEIHASEQGSLYSDKIKKALENVYPQYIEEIKGLAKGAEIDFQTAWALSIKNELFSLKKSEPGCSTIYYKNEGKSWLFHNEDGNKEFKNKMIVAKIHPPSGVSFLTLLYPGIVAGVGPSLNAKGVAQTTNYIGCLKPGIGVPRYFVGRAILEAKSFSQAVEIATSKPRAYPWHHNLLSVKTGAYASVETLPEGTVNITYPEDGLYLHTNHTIGKKTKNYEYQDLDYKNSSSTSRMQALRKLASEIEFPINNPKVCLNWLSSHRNSPYSPCRHPKGDIHGQTLATAFFDSKTKTMRIYKGNPCLAVGKGLFKDYSFDFASA